MKASTSSYSQLDWLIFALTEEAARTDNQLLTRALIAITAFRERAAEFDDGAEGVVLAVLDVAAQVQLVRAIIGGLSEPEPERPRIRLKLVRPESELEDAGMDH